MNFSMFSALAHADIFHTRSIPFISFVDLDYGFSPGGSEGIDLVARMEDFFIKLNAA